MNRRASKIFRRGPRAQAGTHPVDLADGLEHAHGLDRAIRSISGAVHRTLRPGPVKNALHGVPYGHPAHPTLSDVPIGCWTSAGLLDLLPGTRRASQVLVAAGLATAVPTTLTGITDWAYLHRQQQRVGLVHAATMAAATLLYTASYAARAQGRDAAGRVIGFTGLTTLMAGGYLGGHMAFRQAAGANHADQIAHLVPLGWHDLCTETELPDGWPVQRRLGYISLFVLRSGNDIHVLTDRCSHLAGPLHQGRIIGQGDDLCVICPWHGSTFRVDDGSVVHGPATGRQPSFETRVLENGTVQVRPVG